MSIITTMFHQLPIRAAALICGLALLVCGLAASVASAQPIGPGGKASCTYAGGSYSHGSQRYGEAVTINGKKWRKEFTCDNGEWVQTDWVQAKTGKPAGPKLPRPKLPRVVLPTAPSVAAR